MITRYLHKKTGGTYRVLDENLSIEATCERAVLYQKEDTGSKWVRPWAEFMDGRFERIEDSTAPVFPPAPRAFVKSGTITFVEGQAALANVEIYRFDGGEIGSFQKGEIDLNEMLDLIIGYMAFRAKVSRFKLHIDAKAAFEKAASK